MSDDIVLRSIVWYDAIGVIFEERFAIARVATAVSLVDSLVDSPARPFYGLSKRSA